MYHLKTIRPSILAYLFCTLLPVLSSATTWYVSPVGSSSNVGTYNSPWSLEHALLNVNEVQPGDSVLLFGGDYFGGFESELNGLVSNPIVVSCYNNEKVRVIIDGNGIDVGLVINGNYSWFIGIEITSTVYDRVSNETGSNPSDINTNTGINVFGEGTKIINCIIHDCNGVGIGYWKTALDAEVYGCFIFNNGWQAPDRGHGHGLYVQNADGSRPKHIRNSYIFKNASQNINVYTTNPINRGVGIEQNTVFNATALSPPSYTRKYNLIIGSANAYTTDIYVSGNIFYRDTTDGGINFSNSGIPTSQNIKLGYGSIADSNFVFSNNYIVNGYNSLWLKNWQDMQLENNTFLLSEGRTIYTLDGATPSGLWDNNSYFNFTPFSDILAGNSLNSFQSLFNVDLNSNYEQGYPISNFILSENNVYDQNRTDITILNFEMSDYVSVDLSSQGFTIGDSIIVYDIQDILDGPLETFEYNGSPHSFNMNLNEVANVYGNLNILPKHTDKRLGTFMLKRKPENVAGQNALTSNDIQVFQSEDRIIIKCHNYLNRKIEVSLFSLNGRVLNNQVFFMESSTIELPVSLSKGIYIVRVEFEGHFYTQRLIIDQ